MLHFNKISSIYNAQAKKITEAIFLHFLINFLELKELIMLVLELSLSLSFFILSWLKITQGLPKLTKIKSTLSIIFFSYQHRLFSSILLERSTFQVFFFSSIDLPYFQEFANPSCYLSPNALGPP